MGKSAQFLLGIRLLNPKVGGSIPTRAMSFSRFLIFLETSTFRSPQIFYRIPQSALKIQFSENTLFLLLF